MNGTAMMIAMVAPTTFMTPPITSGSVRSDESTVEPPYSSLDGCKSCAMYSSGSMIPASDASCYNYG